MVQIQHCFEWVASSLIPTWQLSFSTLEIHVPIVHLYAENTYHHHRRIIQAPNGLILNSLWDSYKRNIRKTFKTAYIWKHQAGTKDLFWLNLFAIVCCMLWLLLLPIFVSTYIGFWFFLAARAWSQLSDYATPFAVCFEIFLVVWFLYPVFYFMVDELNSLAWRIRTFRGLGIKWKRMPVTLPLYVVHWK